MNIAGIVFLTLGILFIVIPGIVALAKRDATPMFFSLYSLLWFFLFPLVNYPGPMKSDVRDGKAVYVEEKHITNGIISQDTHYLRNLYQELSMEHKF